MITHQLIYSNPEPVQTFLRFSLSEERVIGIYDAIRLLIACFSWEDCAALC
jgi:hypothetical protein